MLDRQAVADEQDRAFRVDTRLAQRREHETGVLLAGVAAREQPPHFERVALGSRAFEFVEGTVVERRAVIVEREVYELAQHGGLRRGSFRFAPPGHSGL